MLPPFSPLPLATLDSVSDSAFHYFTTQLTPPTDKECFWAYGIGKCLPRCKCSYQPKVRHDHVVLFMPVCRSLFFFLDMSKGH